MEWNFVEPEKIGEWFLELLGSQKVWNLDVLAKALHKHESITRCSLQNKRELAQLLMLYYARRETIRYYIEIGICRCGTFYVVDQFLKTFAPHYQGSFAIDGWHAPWTKYGFAEYQQKCSWVRGINKEIQQVLNTELPQKGGVIAFIDCEHSYSCTKAAWDKVEDCAGMIIFDDIDSQKDPGPRQLWEELKLDRVSAKISLLEERGQKGNGYGILFQGDMK